MLCSLFKSLASLFATSFLYFQQLAASFRKIPGGGVSRTNLRDTRATSATPSRPLRLFTLVREGCVIISLRLCSRVSPFPLRCCISFRINTCKSVSKQTTLTSFRINTCEKPRGRGGTSFRRFFSPLVYPDLRGATRHSSLTPSHAPRGASILCGLTRLRILPVTTGVYTPNARSAFVVNPSGSPFVITTIQTPFPPTPLFSHPSKSLGGVGAFGPESCIDL